MTNLALYDASLFAVGRRLVAEFATFRSEAEALAEDEFTDWPERTAYSTGWRVFPLLMAGMPPGLCVDFAQNQARCPRSAAVLRRDPRVICGGFSRLLPGCHIYPHTDHPEPFVLRFHLVLRNAGRAGLRVAGETLVLPPGEAQVFDHSFEHEAGNLGTEPRDVLLVDFRLEPAEAALVQRRRAAGGMGAASA